MADWRSARAIDPTIAPGGARLGRRHWAIALLVHGLLFALLYYLGPYNVETSRRQRQLDASERLTGEVRTQQRVQDLEKIKALLEQSSAAASDRPADAPARPPESLDSVESVDFSPTSLPERPEALLAQARELAESIGKIDKENQVEELARVLKVGKDEARAQLERAAAPPPQPPPAADGAERSAQAKADAANPASPPGMAGLMRAAAAPGNSTQASAEIQKLEEKARAALRRRETQLNGRQNGVQVGLAAPAAAAPAAADPSGSAEPVAVTERIAAFLNRDVPFKQTGKNLYGGAQQDIFDRGVGGMPRVDASTMIQGSGRVIGAGGPHATRVYVNNWYVIGPFEGKHGRDMFDNFRYPPEQGVILDAVYRGKENRLLQWQYISKAEYPLTPRDFAEDAVYYGYTELMVDAAQEVTLWMGADDDAQVWLNDRQIWAGGNINKGWFWREIYDTRSTYVRDFNLNEVKRVVRLNKGRNKVFFKLSNGPNRTFFSMVMTK